MKRLRGKRHYTAATKDWAYGFGLCWRCRSWGIWRQGLEIHHVPGGSNRHANNIPSLCIACRECHSKEETSEALGNAAWMALKRHYDPTQFNLARLYFGRRPGAKPISEADVDAAEAKLIERGILLVPTWR